MRQINAPWGNPFSGSGIPPSYCWRRGFPCGETLLLGLAADCWRIREFGSYPGPEVPFEDIVSDLLQSPYMDHNLFLPPIDFPLKPFAV